jgi:hypothetical protein
MWLRRACAPGRERSFEVQGRWTNLMPPPAATIIVRVGEPLVAQSVRFAGSPRWPCRQKVCLRERSGRAQS